MKRGQNRVRSDASRAPQTGTCAIATFLRHELAGGPVAVLELERRARRAGLLGEAQRIPRTKKFRTAKTDLGIESIRIGFGRGGEWAWKLGAPKSPDSKADGHLCEETTPSVIKAEPEPAIIHSDANPHAELGSKLSRVAGANTGLSPAFVEIGGIPRKWSEGVERLQVQARPREVAPHLWHQFVEDAAGPRIVRDTGPGRGFLRADVSFRLSQRCTLRFSADVLPLLGTSSYSTICPSFRPLRPAFSTAEMWTNTSLPPPPSG